MMETELKVAYDQDNNLKELNEEHANEEHINHSERRLLKCRLCSSMGENGVMAFSDEGLVCSLQQHIKKYLYITIAMDDKFTKFVCTGCVSTLEHFHRFALMASQSQRNLINAANLENNSNFSLLHAYLTEERVINDHDYTSYEKPPNATALPVQTTKPKKLRKKTPNNSQPNSKTINNAPRKRKTKENCNMNNESNNIESTIINSELVIDEPATSDSNTHETLEVVVDPSLYLESSCESSEHNSNCINPICLMCGKDTPHECTYYDCLYPHFTENNNNEDIKVSPISIEQGCELDENNADYDCPICGKNNFTKHGLQLHLRIHRPKGKHECNICKRIFKTNANLDQHKIFHTRMQFQCATCYRVYSTQSTLKAHAITHSDLRPHQCQLCEKSFKRNQDLKFHMNQHTGARPYKCIYCSRAFASSGNCFSHRKRMHPNEVDRDQKFAANMLM